MNDDGFDEDGSDDGPGFASMSTTCPTCGERMRPVTLPSGSVVLRCERCGQITI